MITIEGKHNTVEIFTDTIDKATNGQLTALANTEYLQDSIIKVMPDCHAGKGCTIGTVIEFKDKLCPGFVSCDIGCGMLAIKLDTAKIKIKVDIFDRIVHDCVPSGFNIHESPVCLFPDLENIKADIDIAKAYRSIGTLGGGNHFIEIDVDNEFKNIWLIIHSGSRYLGTQIYEYYQNLAYNQLKEKAAGGSLKELTNKLIDEYKATGKEKKLSKAIQELKKEFKETHVEIPYELAYLEGEDLDNYLHDIAIVNEYAKMNREIIAAEIMTPMKLKGIDSFHTIHNYVDVDNHIARKGAISAKKDEIVVIPMNMRDGTLLCKGKGNKDWLESGPHGAGRLMSRNEAKNNISMSQYRDSMAGVYSTCINKDTIDESCFAYKSMDSIINNIQDTVEIIDILKPIYNFKAGGKE